MGPASPGGSSVSAGCLLSDVSPPGDFLGTHRYRIHWRDYIYISSPGGTWVSSRKSWTVSPMWEQDVQRCLGELIPERWRKSEMET